MAIGIWPFTPKLLYQFARNIIAVQLVPFVPQSPSEPWQSMQYSIVSRMISAGISSRSNKKLTASSIDVGPQSYSVS